MTDFKKDTRTAEEQAEARYIKPNPGYYSDDIQEERASSHNSRIGYAACITEQVTPRDEFIEELVEALDRFGTELTNCDKRVNKDGTLNHGPTCRSSVANERTERHKWCRICNANELLTKARDRGYDHE